MAALPAKEVKRVRGIVDCAGLEVSVGDSVVAGEGFDGPLEVAFSTGRVEQVGRAAIQVWFADDPERVHQVTPGTVRRVG